MSRQAASTSSPSSSMTSKWKYDVFLSFRGEDTRQNFTDHLFAALKRKGILTFKDDEELGRGKSILPTLLKTIEESRFAIVIFSRNYASSSWCLDELANIVRCKKETGLTILPIFYDVDPSEVRKQTRIYGQAFNKHEDKENIEKVKTWRDALKEVASISGWPLQNRHEAEFIKGIVEDIFCKLNSKSSRFIKDLVGIDSSVEELFTLYTRAGLVNNVCMIGICGMGGLGKTTLARAVYNRFSNLFEGCCFIEVSKNGGLISLQQQLLREVLKEKISKIWNVCDGVDMIKRRLHHKRVLLVLDDVNQLDQLEKLVGEPDWFGLGSWIIITTRDERLLFQHDVRNKYSPHVLNTADALKLFCLKAFKNENPEEGYEQLSQNIVHYANGLPLALVTLGSFLFGRTMEEWKSALVDLKQIPQENIFDTLKVSFDGLDQETWKEIFLDIACFFRGKAEGRVIELLKYHGFEPTIGIKVLMERSLITIENNKLWMHDLLQEMGRRIVLESHEKLRKHSRLWSFKDLLHVLKKDTEAEALQAIVLNHYEWETQDWRNFETFPDAFSKMCNLRLLIIHNVHITNGLNHVSNNLRFLQWTGYTSECLPSSFQPKELVELCLIGSKIKYLWKGVKYLDNLKCMDLRYSKDLIETPDFRGVPRLERLHLSWCNNLVEIHPSIGQLSRLIVLDLEYCVSLIDLPSMSSEMESLKILKLCGCSEIRKIPEFKGIMRSLSELHLDKTTIEKLPSSVKCLTALTLLSLRDCQYLTCLPHNKDSLRSLEKLVVIGCSKLNDVPAHLRSIKCLECDLSRIAFRQPSDRNVSVRCRSLSPTINRILSPSRVTRPWLTRNNGFIGREDEENEIINRLLDPNGEVKIAIVGLCKTTLAEQRLKKRFKFNLEVLMDQVHNKIYQTKFLVVLDDRGNENCKTWNHLKSLLFSCAKGSRIIITMHDKSVVDITRANATHFLEGPSEDYSRSFFVAFENSQDTKNPTVVDYGREIVGKCQQCLPSSLKEPLKHRLIGSNQRFLQWDGYSLKCLPSSFEPKKLVVVNLNHSKIEYLWKGVENLDSLKLIDLSYSNEPIKTLDYGGKETSIRRKEDGFGIAFQMIIPGYEIPGWITHQRSGNSISIGLPPNWCNSKWMGFALCASLDASYSHISVEEFDLIGKTFGLKASVIARGDTPHSYYATAISCSTKLVTRRIWLLYFPHDDWFATARSGEFNQIEVVFESSRPGLFVRKCGLSLVYKQDVEMFTQTICSSNRITFEGCDGSHDEFDNLWRNCDDYNNNEPRAICSSSEEIESFISSVNGIQILYPSNISASHQKNCYCPARAQLKTIFTAHENFVRRFWSCGKMKQNVNCGFFEWEDPEMCSHERRVICELQERLETIDKDKVDQDELVMLREKERMLCIEQNKLEKLLVVRNKENKNLRIGLWFFGIALLFSWIAIVIFLCNLKTEA